jgi:iron complex transport system ATP-binding protein
VLPQASRLHFSFSVLEVVLMGRTPHVQGRAGPADWAIAENALEAAGMGGFVDREFPTLSGGEQQRVHLARALAQVWTAPDDTGPDGRRRYLLLDEPTASLDLAHQQNVLQTAHSFADEGGGVLAILHDLNLAAQFADHVVVMAEGRVRTQGAPETVFTPPCIREVFGCPVCVLAHPTQSCPLIVPDGTEAEATGSPPNSF